MSRALIERSERARRRWEKARAPLALALTACAVCGIAVTGKRASAASGSTSSNSPDEGISPAAARSIVAKWQTLSGASHDSPNSARPIVITDVEANSYLQLDGHAFLPHGVYNPRIHITPEGISGNADVDFNELNRAQGQSNDWGATLLGELFQGRQHLSAVGELSSGNRQAKLTFQDVRIGSTALSDWLVNWLLQAYVESKYKIDLSKPFALPGNVTRIALLPGRAVFERGPQSKH